MFVWKLLWEESSMESSQTDLPGVSAWLAPVEQTHQLHLWGPRYGTPRDVQKVVVLGELDELHSSLLLL